MGVDKTARDIANEKVAHEINRRLMDAGVCGMRVVGGGGKGPFALVVDRLSRKRLAKVMAAVGEVLGSGGGR